MPTKLTYTIVIFNITLFNQKLTFFNKALRPNNIFEKYYFFIKKKQLVFTSYAKITYICDDCKFVS